jgi:hypothetical protein
VIPFSSSVGPIPVPKVKTRPETTQITPRKKQKKRKIFILGRENAKTIDMNVP